MSEQQPVRIFHPDINIFSFEIPSIFLPPRPQASHLTLILPDDQPEISADKIFSFKNDKRLETCTAGLQDQPEISARQKVEFAFMSSSSREYKFVRAMKWALI